MTILAGGIGSRFWPVSTANRPKQLLPLASECPLIVDTMRRARGLTSEDRIRILTGGHLAERFESALADLPEECLMVEAQAKGTAPVLVWSAWHLQQLDPDAVIVSLHADHMIRPEAGFRDLVRHAVDIARTENLLLTVAAPPDRPETGYGYIEPGEAIASAEGVEAFRVASFLEKPDAAAAEQLIEAGNLWNTGIFIWTARCFLEEVREVAPEIATHLPLLEEGRDLDFFEAVPNVPVDIAVLERSQRVGAVTATFAWDDVGSWEALARTRECDGAQNVLVGNGFAYEATGNLTYTEDGAIVLFGVDDLVVVRTEKVTLVTRRDRAPDLKSLLARLPDDLGGKGSAHE